ncbi:MAG: endonuclease MutS2 [Cellulosilyticaceae bacterium]
MNNQTLEKLQYYKLKEIVKSYCVSSLGKDRVEKLMPSGHQKTVINRLEETTEARRLLDITGNVPLMGLGIIQDVMEKIEKDIILNEEQLVAVSEFLHGCNRFQQYMNARELESPTLVAYSKGLQSFTDIEEEINLAIRNNRVADEASSRLKKIRRHMIIAEEKIQEKLNQFIKNANNKSYLQEQFISKRQGKWTVPIKNAYKNKIQGIVVEATDKTAFMELNSVSKYTAEYVNMEIEESVEVYKILSQLTELIFSQYESIKSNMDIMAMFDLLFAKAKYSRAINGKAPKVNAHGIIDIHDARHPLLEGNVVPLNVTIGQNYRSLIITGPNAGGKTIVLKTIGLLTLAMQSGFHIPVGEKTNLSVFEHMYVDIGDGQSIENALSTFSAHVKNLSEIVKQTGKSTLLLFDEIGSGTEPGEGAALAIAILEEVYQKGAITVASTHYNEIKTFSENHPDFENAAMQFNRETLEPLYKLLVGYSGESNALWIAKKMGISDAILKRANTYIHQKDYQYGLIDTKKKRVEEIKIEEEKVILEKGDVVYLHAYEEEAVVYQPQTAYEPLLIFYKKEMITVDMKRLTLRRRAADLYPDDYDFDTIFVDFKTKKLEKDIKRGSKKALKNIRKNNSN